MNHVKAMLDCCVRSEILLPLKWAPVQLCRIAVQEQVVEESQSIQSEGGGGGVENENHYYGWPKDHVWLEGGQVHQVVVQLGPPFWHESYHGG